MKCVKIFRRWKKTRGGKFTTTHECFAFVLTLGRCFAMFPLKNLRKSDHRLLRFGWISLDALYSLIYLAAILFVLSCHVYNFSQSSSKKFGYVVTLIFYVTNLVTTLLFVRLAREWPGLIEKWTAIDLRMRFYETRQNLGLRLKIISMVVLLAAFIEHGLYMVSAILDIEKAEGWKKLVVFLRNNFDYVFKYVPFALWKGILLLIVNVMVTFTWNYMDLCIMIISTAVTTKFKQITTRVRIGLVKKHRDVLFWRGLREDYNAVAALCNVVDDTISDIILISFGNNLFLILVQLFNSLKPKLGTTVGKIYFDYSFAFLVIRTAAVCLYMASINEASKEPTHLLLSVSPDVYNIEIERLLYKIHADPCALTGKKFFKVTKSLILHIAGAIVTYELVLIQSEVVL